MAKKLKWETVGTGITKAEVPVISGPLTGEDRAEINERIGPEDITALPEEWARETLADAGITGGNLSEIGGEWESPEWFAYSILETIAAIRAGEDVARQSFILGLLVGVGGLKFGHEPAILAHARSRSGAAEGGSKGKKIGPVVAWLRGNVKQYPGKPGTFFWNSLPDHDGGDSPVRVNGATLIREGRVLVVTGKDGRPRYLTLPSFRRYVAIVIKLNK